MQVVRLALLVRLHSWEVPEQLISLPTEKRIVPEDQMSLMRLVGFPWAGVQSPGATATQVKSVAAIVPRLKGKCPRHAVAYAPVP